MSTRDFQAGPSFSTAAHSLSPGAGQKSGGMVQETDECPNRTQPQFRDGDTPPNGGEA